jgi:hypothetical protein
MPGDPPDDLIEKACDADPLPPIEEDEPIPGTPLSAAEIARERSRLADWQPSDAFITTTNALRTRCRASDFFNRSKESPKNYRIGLIGSPPTKSAVKAKKVEALVFGTLLSSNSSLTLTYSRSSCGSTGWTRCGWRVRTSNGPMG